MAFNPVFRVGDVALRALRRHGAGGSEATDRVDQAMRGVLLSPDLLRRYPSQLSGGQLQRVAIALASRCAPRYCSPTSRPARST